MSFEVLTDATIWLAGVDATCDTNQVSVPWSCAVNDRTTFCSQGNVERQAGIHDSGLDINAFHNDDFVLDALLDSVKGQTNTVGSVTVDGSDGSVGYFGKRLVTNIGKPAKVGDLWGVAMQSKQNVWPGMVRGQLLFPKQSLSGNTTGTGQELGDIASTEHLFAAIHCFTAGTTASVIIESDDNSGFSSATTRSTTVVTTTGATWVSVDPTITDTHWRVRVGTVTGTFVLAVLVGIQ